MPEVRTDGTRRDILFIGRRIPEKIDNHLHWIPFRNNQDGSAHIPPENPPIITGFHPPNASSFRFRILQADENWNNTGTIVADSGWKKIAIWWPNAPLTPGNYLVEYWYKTASGRIYRTPQSVTNQQRIQIPPEGSNEPQPRTVNRTTTQEVIQTIYNGPKPDPTLDRHAIWSRFRTELVAKGNNSSLPSAYRLIQYIIGRWHGNENGYSLKAYFQHLETNQNLLEAGQPPENMQRNNLFPHDYIFDPNNPLVDPGNTYPRPVIGQGDGYLGFRTFAGHILAAVIVYLWHNDPAEKQEALKFVKFFLQKFFQTVMIKNTQQGRVLRPENDPEGYGFSDNFPKALWCIGFVYDLLYDEIKNATGEYSTIIGEGNPPITHSLEEGIRIYSLKLLKMNYMNDSAFYNNAGYTERQDARLIHPYDSHMQDNVMYMFVVALAFNKLLGPDFERFVDREIHRLYATILPWSLGDIGDNEGVGYIIVHSYVYALMVALFHALGINLRFTDYVGKRMMALIYLSQRGAQECFNNDLAEDPPLEYNSNSHWISILLRLLSHYLSGATDNEGTREGRLFRSFAVQKNFWNSPDFHEQIHGSSWDGQTVILPALLFYPSLNKDLYLTETTTLPLDSIPEDSISKVTKICYVTTGVARDLRIDRTINGRAVPCTGLRLIGLRLRRQSHGKDAQNSLYFTAGGELIIGSNSYGYTFDFSVPQRKEYAVGTFGYNVPSVLPLGSTGLWHWNAQYGNIPIRYSQREYGIAPTVSLSEIYTYEPACPPEIGRARYIEHTLDDNAYYFIEKYNRRVLILKDWPALVVLDEVTTKTGLPVALLWPWWGHNYVADNDENYNANNWADRNRSPFENLANPKFWRVYGTRHGAWRKYFSHNHLGNPNNHHPAQRPRFAAIFGIEGPTSLIGHDGNPIYFRAAPHRPFENNTLFRDPSWDPTIHFGNANAIRKKEQYSVPHPLCVWTTTNPNATNINQNVGYIPGGITVRAGFWCVPYRIRQEPIVNNEPDETQEAPIIPNAHDENIWISARKDLPDAIEIGVFNNATTGALAKKGFIAKFRTHTYNPEQNAVEITFLANEEEWTSWQGPQPA